MRFTMLIIMLFTAAVISADRFIAITDLGYGVFISIRVLNTARGL